MGALPSLPKLTPDDRYWRLDWFGECAYPGGVRRYAQPSIRVVLSPLRYDPNDKALLSPDSTDHHHQHEAWPPVRVGDSTQDQHIRPAFCTNDEAFELRAVLAGEIIGQLAIPTAAALIRSGRLVPLLLEHMTDNYSLFVYYGSRAAQPARVRRFIDLVVERLTDNVDFVLGNEELASAPAKGMAALDQ